MAVEPTETIQRRTFLKRAFLLVNGAIAAIVAVPALRYLLDPLARSRKDGAYLRVAPLSALVPGQPTRMPIISGRDDAYTRYPPGTIGQVFLTRQPEGATVPAVKCLQTICPHLGCAVNYVPEGESFACPCHTSDFDKNGQRVTGPAPRGLDPLECRVTPDGWVEVRYQEFEVGIARRVVKT